MNRPIKPNANEYITGRTIYNGKETTFLSVGIEVAWDDYYKELEKYCDELESKLNTYEKALDKACELIANKLECLWDCPMLDKCKKSKELPCTKEGWKEWLMKDETEGL